jgi:hypothetical protein
MNVIVRTHGGLGNQIFQLFYARLYAVTHKVRLFEIHDLRYAHAFERSSALASAPLPPLPMQAISALRLPKIATRLKLCRDAMTIFGATYLDGYFQCVADYAPFDDLLLRGELLRLRAELNVTPAPAEGLGIHLRLGDFFTSEAAITTHLKERLMRLGSGASIITNEEHRLNTPPMAEVLAMVGARIIPTGDMSAEAVLRTLAGFARVDGNDSTLLFWASVLSGMECEYRNPELRALRARFLRAMAS